MTNLIAVSKKNHAKHRFRELTNLSIAKSQSSCPVCIAEIRAIIQTQVLVFMKEKEENFGLYALQGFFSDQNLFINEKGNWRTRYTPAIFRGLPFIFVTDGKKGDLVLCYDDKLKCVGKNFKKTNSFDMFDEKGEPSQKFKEKIHFSKNLHENFLETRSIVSQLAKLDLIDNWPIRLKFDNDEREISGLFKINEEKLLKLTTKQVSPLLKTKALELAYGQVFSMLNVNILQDFHTRINKTSKVETGERNIKEETLRKQKEKETQETNQLVRNLLAEE